MERLLDPGVDGIMSDRVTALKDVFERRGPWRRCVCRAADRSTCDRFPGAANCSALEPVRLAKEQTVTRINRRSRAPSAQR